MFYLSRNNQVGKMVGTTLGVIALIIIGTLILFLVYKRRIVGRRRPRKVSHQGEHRVRQTRGSIN